MIKFVLLFTVLFVSTHAKPAAFPFLGGYMDPYNLDDGQQQDDQQQIGQQDQANPQNEPGDTPDDGEQVGAAGQSGTTVPPSGEGSSSSSSSSEEEGSEAPDAPDTPNTVAPAGPIVGNQAGVGGPQGAGTGGNAGGSSGNVIAAVGGPNYAPQKDAGAVAAPQGGSSQGNVNVADANPLSFGKPQAVKNKESRQAGAMIGLTTFMLVAGVATVSVFAYKYKDAITARLGW